VTLRNTTLTNSAARLPERPLASARRQLPSCGFPAAGRTASRRGCWAGRARREEL